MRVVVGRWLYRAAAAAISVYRFVRRPTIHGVRCLIESDGRVLMVRHTYGPSAWTFPGGRRRRNEESPDAARREIAEELSLDVPRWTPIGQVRVGGAGEATQVVDCYWCADDRKPVPNAIEIAEVGWFPIDAMPEATIEGTEAMARLLSDHQASVARR